MSAFAVLGAASGLLVLGIAVRRRWLTRPAGVAALVTGTVLVVGTHAAGPVLLVFFLVSASAIGHIGGDGASQRETNRTARQVVANSVVPACAGLLAVSGLSAAGAAVAGAIAAMTADTWATEVGTGLGAPARLITNGRRVRPGESGGISLPGTAAGVVGALGVAALAAGLPPAAWGPAASPSFTAVLAGGIAGLFADSWLGAAIEGRVRAIDNERVNLLASAVAAAVAALVTSGVP